MSQQTAPADSADLLDRVDALRAQLDSVRQFIASLEDELAAFEEALCGRPIAARPASLDDFALAGASSADRRSVPRRRGHPVAIEIAAPGNPGLTHGWVVDRSPEGLCLVAEHETAVGSVLRIRPEDGDAAWFEIQVRNCRFERSIWVLGCHFLVPLSWKDLRRFR
jgi:hypothetical protein